MDFAENLKLYAKLNTRSIAVPTSIFQNVPSPQLEAYLVGQISRAAVIFYVTEIILFDEENTPESLERRTRLTKLFEYAECPQYLRKSFFHLEPDLKFAGMINPLEAHHHLRSTQIECPYREGVSINHVTIDDGTVTTTVNIGLTKPVRVKKQLDIGSRVTVKVDPADLKKINAMLAHASPPPEAVVVPPTEPLTNLGLNWGYYVRGAKSLSEALSQNSFEPTKKKFYNIVIGTSERGTNIDEVNFDSIKANKTGDDEPPTKKKKSISHLLVVFGGIKGLEHSKESDPDLKDDKRDVSNLFDYYLNTCQNQGSNTIRTEEAILVTMSALRHKLKL